MCNVCDMEIDDSRELQQLKNGYCGSAIELVRKKDGYFLVYDDDMEFYCYFCPNCGRKLK